MGYFVREDQGVGGEYQSEGWVSTRVVGVCPGITNILKNVS